MFFCYEFPNTQFTTFQLSHSLWKLERQSSLLGLATLLPGCLVQCQCQPALTDSSVDNHSHIRVNTRSVGMTQISQPKPTHLSSFHRTDDRQIHSCTSTLLVTLSIWSMTCLRLHRLSTSHRLLELSAISIAVRQFAVMTSIDINIFTCLQVVASIN